MSLEGKTALITGGGTGIGRALAVEASHRGMRIALVGRRLARLEETRALLDVDTECLLISGDITEPSIRSSVRDRLAKAWGLLDILVNNAGIVAAGALSETRDADIMQMMAINVVAPIGLTRELLPLLRSASSPRVVNVGSVFGDIGYPLFAAYCASKFALRGLSNALRRELRSEHIGVTYVAPRGVRTDATDTIANVVKLLKMTLDSPEQVGQQVWQAVNQQRNHAYPPSSERIFVLIERLFPSLIDRAVKARFEPDACRISRTA